MEPTLEIFSSQINILGNFNPPVISPAWLRSNRLIGSDDEEVAMECESLAITPEISRFETDWFWIQIIKTQFVAASKGPVTPAIKDLVIGIFTLLGHTPLTALGLNSLAHYKVYTLDEYHKIGDTLAPKRIWNSFYPESDMQTVGLQEMSILITPTKRGQNVINTPQKRVSVASSDKLPNGVYFTFNNHFPIPLDKKRTSADVAIEIIETHWQSSMDESTALFKGVITQALNA